MFLCPVLRTRLREELIVIVKELIVAGLVMACPMVASAERTEYMEVTAYTDSYEENGRDDGITASGELAIPYYTCAADHLPFGTTVIVDGYEYVVTDRFGGDYTDRLDLCMATQEECEAFGRQMVEVIVYDNDDE